MTDFPWLTLLIAIVSAAVAALVITAVAALVLRVVGRRKTWPANLIQRARIPFRITLLLVLVWIAVEAALPAEDWRSRLTIGFRVVFIAALAWLIGAVALFLEDLGLGRYRLDVPDNRIARRLRTQVLIIRRLTVVVVVVLAAGAILLSFPGVEALGASVLASAGLLSVVAGIAAQSSLANVFAGIQLAFSDALRVDDVVVVEEEWGRVEEITLTYVVLHLWDDRRLVLPSTWFNSNPFQNWTRRSSELLGAVEIDVDWRVSTDDLRVELVRLLDTTDLWDRRTQVLQVTDAVGGMIRVRALVTAVDAPTLFDLRCYVREGLIVWLNRHQAESIPAQRVQLVEPPSRTRRPKQSTHTGEVPTGLFTGGADAQLRAGHLTGSIPVPEEHDAGVHR